MSDRAAEAAGAVPQTSARPYGWIGLLLSLVALIVLGFLLFIAAIMLAWAVQIPFEGWQQMSGRLADAYQAAKQGELTQTFLLLIIGSGKHIGASLDNSLTCLLQLNLAASVFLLARFRGRARWRDLIAWRPWSWRQHGRLFWLLLVSAVALNVAVDVLFAIINPAPAAPPAPFDLPFILGLLRDLVLAAIFEELIIRGWLYTGLRAKLSAWPTIVITSVLFALGHGPDLQDVLAVLPLGVAAGYLRERTGSVKATITLHLLHNVVATVLTVGLSVL